jgi:vacuolar protein-sorting-associated protein 4
MEGERLRALAAYSELARLVSVVAVKGNQCSLQIDGPRNPAGALGTSEEDTTMLEAAIYRVSQTFTLLKTFSTSPLEIGLMEEVRSLSDEIQQFLLQPNTLVRPPRDRSGQSRKRTRHDITNSHAEANRPVAHQSLSKAGGTETSPKELPDTIRAVSPESNTARFEALAGVDQAIQSLRNVVLTPLLYPHWFTGKRRPIHSVLLYGPPGTGKTALANAAASAAGAYLISLSASDLLSKYVGESEKAIRDAFTQVNARTKRQQRVVLFLDEVDALCSKRGSEGESESARRVKTEFLIQLNQLNSISTSTTKNAHPQTPPTGRCIVLAATNLPWDLDSAFRRRFDQMIYIPLPDADGRLQMLRTALGCERDLGPVSHLPNQSALPAIHCLRHDDLVDIAQRLDGYSGSDIQHVVAHALMQPVLKAQSATTFRRLPLTDKWIPVVDQDIDGGSATDEVLVRKTLTHFRADLVELPPVIKQDLLEAISLYPKTVSLSEIERFLTWK